MSSFLMIMTFPLSRELLPLGCPLAGYSLLPLQSLHYRALYRFHYCTLALSLQFGRFRLQR
ncbi:hypothetical protein KC19_VG185200 [Ceratodon purpureus]|uniref:Uncharacterized protein n=1 Tax=Ceratodon purpureus TaxID=3225 RepID=A0A8T0HRR5_CERPU|nr:hypothetical protein KC19_VG185200 [Ceratodon purpureus]